MNTFDLRVGKLLVALFVASTLGTGCGTQIGISASPSEIYVEVDGTASVNIVAVMDIGPPVSLSEPPTISSSDEAIAVVSSQVVTGITEGTAVLSITEGVFTTTATVFVIAAGTLPTDLVLTPTSVSCTAESDNIQLEVFGILTNGSGEDITDQASYSSSDSSVAVVTTKGIVVCVAEGEASITAEFLGLSSAINIDVGAPPPVVIAFPSPSLACISGELYAAELLAVSEDGSTRDVSLSATYSSTDSAVAVVSGGLIYCLSEGSTAILAELSGLTSVLNVDVQPASADSDNLVELRISPSGVACGLAQGTELAVIAVFNDGSTLDVSADGETQYLSSDSTVAQVVSGQLRCIQQGRAIVQVSYGGLVVSVTVTVQ